MLTITIKANVPAADAQGIKERIASDTETARSWTSRATGGGKNSYE